MANYKHGDPQMYLINGCRCSKCVRGNSQYQKYLRDSAATGMRDVKRRSRSSRHMQKKPGSFVF